MPVSAHMPGLRSLFLLAVLLSACASEAPKEADPAARLTDTLSGTVSGFGANPAGDYDRLFVADGRDMQELRFPPHAAARVMDCAKPGATVHCVTQRASGPAQRGLALADLQTNGCRVRVTEIRPLPPEPGLDTQISGKHFFIAKNASGEAAAIVLSGVVTELPPHVRHSIAPLLRNAVLITVHGRLRRGQSGFVNKYGKALLRPDRITVDGATYLIH